MAVDPSSTKFTIHATIEADGAIDGKDVIGAIFGQTDGLLGNELDMRDLQKSARIGRIEVDIETKSGKTFGKIMLPSGLDKAESAILAAALETIDRVGPAAADIKVTRIEDSRSAKRELVKKRAQELLAMINEDPSQDSGKITDDVRAAAHVADAQKFRNTKLWCGPNVESSDSIILVEGRNDVVNLLRCGIKNAIGVGGSGELPKAVVDLSKEKTTTLFVDGDRGGEMIARSIIQTCDVDFVARAPKTREVEELPHKMVMKCLQNKTGVDQFLSQTGISVDRKAPARESKDGGRDAKDGERKPRRRGGRGRGRSDSEEPEADSADKKPARGRRPSKSDDTESDDEEKPRKAPARKAAEKKAPAKKAKKTPGDARAGLRDALGGLAGTLKATLLDDAGVSLKDSLPVRELADTLKAGKNKVHTVVFDGVITQRLLDIAADKHIAAVVGVKMGNVTKVPDSVEILTKDDLE